MELGLDLKLWSWSWNWSWNLRSWNWSWSWNLRSWSWSWYSGDWLELELELKPLELELELELELILWNWPQPCAKPSRRYLLIRKLCFWTLCILKTEQDNHHFADIFKCITCPGMKIFMFWLKFQSTLYLWVSIGSCSGWSLHRQHAITWTNDDQIYCNITVTRPLWAYLLAPRCSSQKFSHAVFRMTFPIHDAWISIIWYMTIDNYTPRTTKLLGGILVSLFLVTLLFPVSPLISVIWHVPILMIIWVAAMPLIISR